ADWRKDMQLSLMRKIIKDAEHGKKGVFCLLTERHGSIPRNAGASMWVYPDGSIEGSVGGGPMEHECINEAIDMLEKGDSVRLKDFNLGSGLNADSCPENSVCGGDGQVYFETIEPEDEVFIFGAGHVGKALSRFAYLCDFKVTVWDERTQYANGENIPWARTMSCPLDELFDKSQHEVLFHEKSYVVIVTRSHLIDCEAMRLMAGRDVAYIGVIGSRGKMAFVDKQLMAAGIPEEYMGGMYRPVGLPLKSETPAEVALCIMAEIVAVKNGANVKLLRDAK
ncbi:MAG: XdhC/CoxI family protein, partial [Synergistaceae bacterium]|nr:XdhC/CoxI family protein [Synergistaceae bacterium]